MPLRRYQVRWSRRFMDGQDHEVRDVILARDRKVAADVVTRLYGAWPGFHLKDVRALRKVRP